MSGPLLALQWLYKAMVPCCLFELCTWTNRRGQSANRQLFQQQQPSWAPGSYCPWCEWRSLRSILMWWEGARCQVITICWSVVSYGGAEPNDTPAQTKHIVSVPLEHLVEKHWWELLLISPPSKLPVGHGVRRHQHTVGKAVYCFEWVLSG